MHPDPRQQAIELNDAQGHAMALETLKENFDLEVDGHRYGADDIWNVVLAASANGQMIESTADDLEEAPCGSTVRKYLRQRLLEPADLEQLEADCNQTLVRQLPAGILHYRHKVAIDLVLTAYHGQPHQDENEVRRSQARSGTTHFHC